jgi:hypothetical protein
MLPGDESITRLRKTAHDWRMSLQLLLSSSGFAVDAREGGVEGMDGKLMVWLGLTSYSITLSFVSFRRGGIRQIEEM